MATQSYKVLLSSPIAVQKNGSTIRLPNGIGMASTLGAEDVSGLPSGCISVGSVRMINFVSYTDAITGLQVVDPFMYTGLYDEAVITEKIKNRLREIAIHELSEDMRTEENIQAKIAIYNEDWIEEEPSSELFVLGMISLEVSAGYYRVLMDKLRYTFQNCPSDQYFFIPLGLSAYNKGKKSGHANGILISKSKGTVYRIEPQYGLAVLNREEIRPNKQKIDEAVRKLVDEIGLKDPTMKYTSVVCPQTIVKDKNCIFWTQLIFRELLKNLYKKDPDTAIRELSSKPKEELDRIVYDYKIRLFQVLIPKFLSENGYRWDAFERQKDRFIREIQNEYATILGGIPVQGAPPRLGGKTRRLKKSRKTRKSKNQRARQ